MFSDFLLQAGADPNARNNVGQTPLHRACLFGRVDVVVVLLGNGADARLGDHRGRTALEVTKERASKNGRGVLKLQAVVLLLEDHNLEQGLNNYSGNSNSRKNGGDHVPPQARRGSNGCCRIT